VTVAKAARKAAPLRGRGGTSSDRRDEILRFAMQVFADKGFANATVRDIGEASGILSGSLYHHFDSKETMLEELLSALLDDIVHSYRQALLTDGDGPTVLRLLIQNGLHSAIKNRDGMRILYNDFSYLRQNHRFAFVDKKIDEILAIFTKTLLRGVSEGTLRSDFDAPLASLVMVQGISSVVRWRKMPTASSLEHVTDELWRLYVDGLRL
jgi:AcrR family transcriptional regulator